ncbi:MAG: hypothetical protein M1818_000976 [Claussenomyces sp. TS43310]|nr:MAG: hypothetical protein M1818_000976 [Claussenomyces sp. TS43310]
MDWFGASSDVGSSHSHGRHSSGERKKHSSSRSIFGGGDDRHSSSHNNSSRASFFGLGGRSTSHYKRSPRKGYLNKMYAQLRRLLRDLVYYLKKNPFKVFVLVIMPLITGGVLTGLLARFGIRLPAGVERMIAKLGGHSGESFGRTNGGTGAGGGLHFEREKYEGPLGGMGKAMGAMGGAGTLMGLAKMFM